MQDVNSRRIYVNLVLFTVLSLLLVSVVYARPVTVNVAFKIGSDKDNIIRVNGTSFSGLQTDKKVITELDKKFISSEKNSKVLSMVFAGSDFLNIGFNTTYSASEYLLFMTQDDNENRFLITFTNGTFANIESKAKDAEMFRTISRIFGNMLVPVPGAFSLFLRLEYRDIDLSDTTRFNGPTRLLIRNLGKSGNRNKLALNVIR